MAAGVMDAASIAARAHRNRQPFEFCEWVCPGGGYFEDVEGWDN